MMTDTAPPAQQWNYDVLEREGEKGFSGSLE